MSSLKMTQTNPVQGDIYESEEDYVSMAELDEENINWGKLCCRILSLVLLVGIIILAAVGSIVERLYYLAIIVAVLLVCVLGISFLDLELLKSRTVHVFRGAPDDQDLAASQSSAKL